MAQRTTLPRPVIRLVKRARLDKSHRRIAFKTLSMLTAPMPLSLWLSLTRLTIGYLRGEEPAVWFVDLIADGAA